MFNAASAQLTAVTDVTSEIVASSKKGFFATFLGFKSDGVALLAAGILNPLRTLISLNKNNCDHKNDKYKK